ncbi:low affinity immunoglobulin epsilon fc receptor [Plakobranchus ocellatus]|uniref:Low affinity immunoglobulin epsilon fc receptor n=1 Tax=Plakobranchus ocellatus TaxID=259542 RepID=A0AAV3Y8Y0_9GAST|nr:low affinity immunoglobulin epsilon fc receptor [Plakobranchus ocellatus]
MLHLTHALRLESQGIFPSYLHFLVSTGACAKLCDAKAAKKTYPCGERYNRLAHMIYSLHHRTKCVGYSKRKLNWYESRNKCREDGGQLLEIQSEKWNKEYAKRLPQRGAFWIGLNDIEVEGKFVWHGLPQRMGLSAPIRPMCYVNKPELDYGKIGCRRITKKKRAEAVPIMVTVAAATFVVTVALVVVAVALGAAAVTAAIIKVATVAAIAAAAAPMAVVPLPAAAVKVAVAAVAVAAEVAAVAVEVTVAAVAAALIAAVKK